MIKVKFNELLDQHDKTVGDLHIETGLSLPTLYKLSFYRNKSMRFETMNTLCKYFDCQLQDLIEYVED